MNSVKLDKNTLIMLGNTVSEILMKAKVNEETVLHIKVDDYSFKKIDEDLFYRMNENNKEKEFIPSEKEIIISFPNVKLIINEKVNY